MSPAEDFLQGFFGPGNDITWASLQQGAPARAMAPFLELYKVASRDAHGLAMLPRLRSSQGLVWYVLSRNPASARQAVEAIQAYLGPTYSDSGRGSALSASDPIDRLVIEHFGAHCFQVNVPSERRETVRDRLQLLAESLRDHPRRGARQGPTVGRLLLTFEQSLDDGEEDSAAAVLEELGASGHLNAMNMAYLQVRLDVAFGRHETALGRRDLLALIDAGVPRKVAAALLRAIFAVHLAPFEAQVDAKGALDRFASVVEPRFRPLYRTRTGLDGYEIDVQFLLLWMMRRVAKEADVDAILATYEVDSPRWTFLRRIASELSTEDSSPSPPASKLDGTLDALRLGNVDQAFALALAADQSPERAAILLDCALQKESPADLATAVKAHDALSGDEQARLATMPRAVKALAEARARLGMLTLEATLPLTPTPVPVGPVVDWVSWLQRLTLTEPWLGAVAAANQGLQQWSIEPLLSSPEAIEKAHQALCTARSEWASEALRDAAPVLIQAWLKQGPEPGLKPLYAALFDRLVAEGVETDREVTALTRLARTLLVLDSRKSDQDKVLEQVSERLLEMASPAVVMMAIDLLEAALDHPTSREREHLQTFASAVTDIANRSSPPASAALHVLLTKLLSDKRFVPPPPTPSHTGTKFTEKLLSERSIAFYSPSEPAVLRAADVFKTLSPAVQIATFASPSGAVDLKKTATVVDVFAVAWGCEGHLAYKQIQSFRPSSRTTLHASGQSASALVSSIVTWLGKASGDSIDGSSRGMIDNPEALAEIGILRNQLEIKLRKFVKHHLSVHLGDKWIDPVLEAIPSDQRKRFLDLDPDQILNSKLMLLNLITVLIVNWGKYFSSLEQGEPSKALKKFHMEALLHFLNSHREDAHAKAISEMDFATLRIVVPLLESVIDSRMTGG